MDVFDTRYLRINKLLLSYVGLWPIQSSNAKRNFYFTIVGVFTSICLPQIAYMFKHARNLDDFYDVLPSFSGVNICLLKMTALYFNFKRFKVLIQHIHDDWLLLAKHENIQVLMDYTERSRMFTLAYISFIFTCAISYCTSPLTISALDFIMGSNVTRPKRLPVPCEFFVDMEKYYYILLAVTGLGSAASGTTVVAIDTIYFTSLQHVCGIFSMLRYQLENLAISNTSEYIKYNVVNKDDKTVECIVKCIELQSRTERLIQLIESTFSICIVVDLGMGILFQCSACVMIVMRMNSADLTKNASLLFIQSSRILLNSLVGQRIIDHSSQIPLAAYSGMWYQISLKAQKMLLLLITRCQKPHYIAMAKLYVINLEGYTMIMKSSVSYITLMMSMNSDNV